MLELGLIKQSLTIWIKANINHLSLIKLGELVSNSVILGTNAFLIGSSITNAIRSKKQEQIRTNLELSCEAASAVAGLTKVIIESIHNVKNSKDL